MYNNNKKRKLNINQDVVSLHHDISKTQYIPDSTGQVVLLNEIEQGTSQSERVGKLIKLSSLQLNGRYVPEGSIPIPRAQLLIVYDKMPTGTLPSVSDILTSSDSYGFTNDDNASRFVILRNKKFVNARGTEPTCENISEYLSLNKYVTSYKELTSGAIADISSGALYMVLCSQNPSPNYTEYFDLSVRLRYMNV